MDECGYGYGYMDGVFLSLSNREKEAFKPANGLTNHI